MLSARDALTAALLFLGLAALFAFTRSHWLDDWDSVNFAFGRCLVLRSDGDELLVQHPASGRTRTIRLSALQAQPPVDEDGKRLFKLTQRRPS